MTWDEYDVYSRGKNLIDYYTSANKDISIKKSIDDGDVLYNHLYPAMNLAFSHTQENGFSIDKAHLFNMLFAYILFASIYIFSYFQLKNAVLSIIPVLFVFLLPRFNGDLAVNPKDIPFTVIFISSILLSFVSNRAVKNTYIKLIIVGALVGFSASLRLIGFILAIPLILDFLISSGNQNNVKFTKSFLFNYLIKLVIPIAIALFIVVITWPYLIDKEFIERFSEILKANAAFPWNGLVLFEGNQVEASKLGRIYFFKMLLITVPSYVFAAFLLLLPIAKRLHKKYYLFYLVLITFFNILLFFVINPVVYDGIRHFLYIYVLLGLCSSYIFIEFLKSTQQKWIKFIALVILLLLVAFNLIEIKNLYPYQYTFYNGFVGGLHGAFTKYETDYWGQSLKEATDNLQRHILVNEEKVVNVKVCANSFQFFSYERYKFNYVPTLEEADYYICYTRFNQHLLVDQSKKLFSIEREGIPLSIVYKLK